MSAEQSAEAQKRDPLTPDAKTDGPKRVRHDSVQLLETKDYVCVTPDAPLSEAIEQMKKDEGGCVIVCEDERVVGIFTERDLLHKIIGQEVDLGAPVRDWMSTSVEMLTPEATIGDAVSVMNEKGYRNIPLIQNDRLVGSISLLDVITYLAESYPKETMNLPPVPAQVMDTQEGG
ncbi:MAG TPA: CBS domain-containing protein [Pyrinomonadaceae bacterium]|jgi:CBS domain-containing protein